MNVYRVLLPSLVIINIFLIRPVSFSQTAPTSGAVHVVASGVNGEPLPEARIRVRNLDTGFVQIQIAGLDGTAKFPSLPPGRYSLSIALNDVWNHARGSEADLRIGETKTIELICGMPTFQDEQVVTATALPSDTITSSATSFISSSLVNSVPIVSRNFRDLIALTPQAVVVQTADIENEWISVGGVRGSLNSFVVDGADSNSAFFGEQRGGLKPSFTYSLGAIRELEVIRSSYNVRFGGANGGIINAVTKSGTNTLHGALHFFYQDDDLITNTDALGNNITTFKRKQQGFDLGGPLIKDRMHFFLSYDSQRRTDNIPRSPLDSGFLEDPSNLAAFIDSLLAIGIDPSDEFDYSTTNDTDVFFGRVDWILGASNRIWFRSSYSDQYGQNLALPFAGTSQSANGWESNTGTTLSINLTSLPSATLTHDVTLQYSSERQKRGPNTTDLPQINIGPFAALFGQTFFLPLFVNEDRFQLKYDSSFLWGIHAVNFGFDANHLRIDDGFCAYCGGEYLFLGFEEFVATLPFRYTQAISPSGGTVSYESSLFSAYLGGECQLTNDFLIEGGVRWDYQDNPHPAVQNQLEPLTGQIFDDSNISPRVGFAWDILGNGRHILRGGSGFFYGWTPSLLVANALLTNGVTVQRFELNPNDAGFPIFPSRIDESFDLVSVAPDIFVFQSNFENPETFRATLNYFRAAASRDLSFGVDLTWSRTRKLMRKTDLNLNSDPVSFFLDGRPIYSAESRLNPDFSKIVAFTSDAEAEYLGAVLSAQGRIGDRLFFSAHYTYSRSKDHDTNERAVSTTDEGWAEDIFNLDQDWAWSDYDARHRIFLMATYHMPYGIALSFISNYRSAFPVNPFSDRDLNGDGYLRDRPGPNEELGIDSHLARNSFRGSSFFTLDLRISKLFSIRDFVLEFIFEAFNATNHRNYTQYDQRYIINGIYNPGFAKPITAGEPRQYQLGFRFTF
jgi:hypothetical protein